MIKNSLEWTVFGLSLALILCVIAVLVAAHVTRDGRPPAIVLKIGDAVPQGESFAVPIEITNDGDTAAENVRFEVILSAHGVNERSETAVALVPQGSQRRAWVTFQQNPAGGTLRARVLGYEEP